MTKPTSQAAVCPSCEARGDQHPGIRLTEFKPLQAVFVGDQAVPPPQKLTCLSCGHAWAVPRGSIEIR